MEKFKKLRKVFVDKPVFSKVDPNNPVKYVMKNTTDKSPAINFDQIADIQNSWDKKVEENTKKTLAQKFGKKDSDTQRQVMNHGSAGNYAFKNMEAHELFDKLVNAEDDGTRMDYINSFENQLDEDDVAAMDEYLASIGSNVGIGPRD